MAEEQNAGSIVYDISADVAPLLKGEQQANAALSNIGTSAVDTASKFKTLDAQVSKTASGVRSSFKSSMQQAGYQIQDFIVQVQGGQSALVAFSQQGSQLAGAFGPAGAVVGAFIALGSVLTGVLITSLNGGKSAMDALKDAAEAMDKVITVSSQGVAALSDKYAALARTNAEVATLMRNQALLEYNQAIAKIPKAITDAADSFVTLGDRAIAAIGGASPSIKNFNSELSALKITTDNWSEAITQAASNGQYASGITNSLSATVNTLASRFGISQQEAFSLAKQLSDLSKNPSPEALQDLAQKLQQMKSSSTDGQTAISTLAGQLIALAREAANAKFNVDALKSSTDNLTSGQKDLIKQSERNLALSKLQGAARAKLQAQYAAEDAGLSKDDPHTVQMMNDAAATYTNIDAQKKLDAQNKKSASQQESIAQKLANLKQQSELAADSTQQLSREQAILTAQQSLGKGATQEQIALAGQYAASKWDTANALKAQAAAEKLLPETKENASYKQDMQDLKTALDGKKISQEQYNQTSEQLEQQHQANLAKIRAQQTVTPAQSAVAEVDPVQRLANQHAQELAMIQQFEQQGLLAHENALTLKTAADKQYEQARTDAQWQLLSQQSLGYNMLTSAVDAFSGSASNALTGLLTGTMSAQEALRSLGNTILNSVINSMVQMGVEALKNMIIGQTIGAASSAASITQAALVSSAWAPAAAMASLATLGGNAAPAAAGIASTVGLATGLALTGMRYNGGPVSAGGLYQVGEKGKPEIYQASTGKQYMIPGDNGKVISNKDMQGSGGINVVLNVQNYNGSSVDAQARSDGNGGLTVDVVIADLNNGGPISNAITSNMNVKRTPRGQ
ncbi:tail protein (tape measure) [Kluyvera intermedia]|uniref:Tail protein (Tape measure) n=2 Tax=root TaxID=1 RepID=A0ABX3U996_KLUIN|nr:tail protein (tape measure) [Kluyvera intermedia]ORJ47844.1 tail protein (tape measure) [Kluyvera intermedia]DAE05996.1 MAG TPA: tail length tape measure protein [Podoviridae sp. ctCWF2]